MTRRSFIRLNRAAEPGHAVVSCGRCQGTGVVLVDDGDGHLDEVDCTPCRGYGTLPAVDSLPDHGAESP